jgi:hypothetical protein
MILHKDIHPTGNSNRGGHVLHYFTFTTTGNMNSSTDALLGPVTLTVNDIGKVARVGSSTPYDFYILTNHTGPVWTKFTGSSTALQAAYDSGSTIVTDGTGNALKVKFSNANVGGTALAISLATPSTDLLSPGRSMVEVDYSPTALQFGHSLSLSGSNMKDSILHLSKDSHDTALDIDSKSGLAWSSVNESDITISASTPSTNNTTGSGLVINAGQGHGNASGGNLFIGAGSTDDVSTSGAGGDTTIRGGAGIGTGTPGGNIFVDGGSSVDTTKGSVFVGTTNAPQILSGNTIGNTLWKHTGPMQVVGPTNGQLTLGDGTTPGQLQVYHSGSDPSPTGHPLLYAKQVAGVDQLFVQPGSGSPFQLQPTAGAYSQVIWRWNETDASQFSVGVDQQSSVVVSKVLGRDGPRLRIAFPTKITGLQLTTLYINDLSLPLTNTDQRRYSFEFRFVGVADFTHYNEWYSFGPAFMMNKASGASHYALAAMAQVGTATRGAKVEGATGVSLSNGTPSWVNLGTMMSAGDERNFVAPFKIDMVQRNIAATKPQFKATMYSTIPGSNVAVLNGGFNSDIAYVADMGALVSGWTSQTLDTVGFAILGNTGTTANYYFEIDSIVVRKHSMDL